MEALQEWGYAVIQALQSMRNPVADLFFSALSFMGNEEFYLLLIPLLYWIVNKHLATRFSVLLLFSIFLNTFLKELASQVRPSAERVAVLDDPGGGGVPSGHAQNGIATWGLLASGKVEPWFRWTMIALIALIGLSRLYLGVHFPHDLLAGWMVGLLLLLTYLAVEKPAIEWLERLPLLPRIAAGAAIPLLLLLVYRSENAFTAMSTLVGLAIGVPLERAYVEFSVARQSATKVTIRLIAGLFVAVLIWRGLKPPLEVLDQAGDFIRYGLLGLWVSAGAPWLFVRSGLATREGVS